MNRSTLIMLRQSLAVAALSVFGALSIAPGDAASADRVAAADTKAGPNSYYPPIVSVDTPEIRFSPKGEVEAQKRLFFVDQVNLAAAGNSFPIVAQAVGDRNATLVIMNIDSPEAMTPYIARAMLARMTSVTRFLPEISDLGLSAEFDIYNMAAVLGFNRIVVTDGRNFSHKAELESAAPGQ